MNLSDVRRCCIRKQLRVEFDIDDQTTCLIDQNGATQLPAHAMHLIGDLATFFASAQWFVVTSSGCHRRLTRTQLAALVNDHVRVSANR